MRPLRLLTLLLVPALSATLLALTGTARTAQGASQAAPAQAVVQPLPGRWLQGYVKTVSGEWILYPWAYPGQTRTLLSRATDGRMAVEWDGEPVPGPLSDGEVTYLWHAGTASGYGAHRFTLSINGRIIATFTSGRTADDRQWSVTGESGVRLSFSATRVGQFNELFGFMWVTAPRSWFGDAAPRFRVAGEAAGSQDYYLGPQEPIETWTRVRAEEALFADGQHVMRVGFSHLGVAQPARVLADGHTLWSGTVSPGYNTVLVPAGPNVAASVPVTVTLGTATTFSGPVAFTAVRPKALHLLPHSHVDIGYSDPQPEVERKQWKNLRDAVALGRKTAAYPPDARFRWNVEGLWSVESYLRQASGPERAAFADAVRAGTIGLQANYTNILTGLATPGELRRWTDAAARIRGDLKAGPIRSAMHSDIPGVSWTAVAALAEGGVRYLSSGPNYMPGLPDGGNRIGATLKALGDAPFWWVSPSGNERLLFWMAGHGYSWFHGLNTGRATDRSRDSVLDYVAALTQAGYRYDMIQVRYTIGGDNGPVDPGLPDFVKSWNETFASPRLVINTADAMFEEFERRHGAALPVMSGDMTPYWEDGAISSAAEEALVRGAARRLQQAETLAALRGVTLPPADQDSAWTNVLLWREHTWGAADSVSQPDRPDVVAQWIYKRRFALEADTRSRRLMLAALPAAGGAATQIDVINTLSWPRTGLVLLTPDQSRGGDRVALVPADSVAPGSLQTARAASVMSGQVRAPSVPAIILPSQRLHDGRLAVWLEHVPALTSVRLRIEAGAAQAPEERATLVGTTLDNGRLRLAVDADTAAATALTWTGSRRHDFVAGAPGLFRYLYLAGRDPAQAQPGTGGQLTVEDAGPLVATVRIDGPAAGASGSTRRFTVVAGSDLVMAEVGLDKTLVRSKESAHLAFPLNIPGGVIRADLGEALVEFGRDQLPGSCRDFIGVQSAVDVSDAARGVSLVSLDAPLVEVGAITDERQNDRGTRSWRNEPAPGTTLYAYLFNNYWHTNYKADQQGPLTFRFVLRPHGAFDPVALRRLSDEQDHPLLAVGVSPATPRVAAPVVLSGDPVTVSSMRLSEHGTITELRLFNPSASTATVIVHMPGGSGVNMERRATMKAMATTTLRLERR